MCVTPIPDGGDNTQEATYRSFRDHGYSGLSVAKIGAEFEKSRSLLYYHYEDKDELLVAFLKHVLDRFDDEVAVDEPTDPHAQLESFLDRLLPVTPDQEQVEFQTAVFELRALAPHDEVYRKQFEKTDRIVRETVAAFIEAGIEEGVFADVDTDATAQLLLTVINGGMLQRVTSDDPAGRDELRQALREYVETHLEVDE